MVQPDLAQCRKVGRRCRDLHIKREFYEREFITFDADRETKLRVYLIAAAICHQTHALHYPPKNLWGWDYLEYGFLKAVRERHVLINPGYMSICGGGDIEGMLLALFSPDGDPGNCTLDRIPERAGMLFEICQALKKNYNSKVSDLIDAARGRLIYEGKGLYESLSRFSAFSDPFRKKITFFIKLAMDAGVLMIRDPENLVPIMDYHMQRVLLRMGCIAFDDPAKMNDLTFRNRVDSDHDIRNACIGAVRAIAAESGHGILAMNDLFWPLGRSCCNETTLCRDKVCLKSPCTFHAVNEISDHTVCYFQEVCRGFREDAYRNLWEPAVETNYY